MDDSRQSLHRAANCPICGRPATERHKPFCSRRCADIDLHRWLREAYRVPADRMSETAEAPDDGSEDDDTAR